MSRRQRNFQMPTAAVNFLATLVFVIGQPRGLGIGWSASAGAVVAFVVAANFIADTANLPLVVSNLVNIVSADFFAIGFTAYAYVMAPVNLAAVAVSLAVLYLCFVATSPRLMTWGSSGLPKPPSATTTPSEQVG